MHTNEMNVETNSTDIEINDLNKSINELMKNIKKKLPKKYHNVVDSLHKTFNEQYSLNNPNILREVSQVCELNVEDQHLNNIIDELPSIIPQQKRDRKLTPENLESGNINI